jgi:hypothetical protein
MTATRKNAATARALRGLAQDYERGNMAFSFTCLNIDDQIGYETRVGYEDTFGFGRIDNHTSNDQELWNMAQAERHELRILLLCFAAALAETGDL